MSFHWLKPNPILVYNDETGAFVFTREIKAIARTPDEETRITLSKDLYVFSGLTPKELQRRLFNMDFD